MRVIFRDLTFIFKCFLNLWAVLSHVTNKAAQTNPLVVKCKMWYNYRSVKYVKMEGLKTVCNFPQPRYEGEFGLGGEEEKYFTPWTTSADTLKI